MSNWMQYKSSSRLADKIMSKYRERVASGLIEPQVEFERRPVSYAALEPSLPIPEDPQQFTLETEHDIAAFNSAGPLLSEIIRFTAREFRITTRGILCQRRQPHLIIPRQAAMYLSRELTTRSFPEIGKAFNRDHTTILHGCRATERRMASDPELRERIEAISAKLRVDEVSA